MDISLIDKLLQAAESQANRNMFSVMEKTLHEVSKRLGNHQLPQEFEGRWQILIRMLPGNREKCITCDGTGYVKGNRCYACQAKGFQTPADTEREKKYWEERELAATRS